MSNPVSAPIACHRLTEVFVKIGHNNTLALSFFGWASLLRQILDPSLGRKKMAVICSNNKDLHQSKEILVFILKNIMNVHTVGCDGKS